MLLWTVDDGQSPEQTALNVINQCQNPVKLQYFFLFVSTVILQLLMLYCDMFWPLYVAILGGVVHVAQNTIPHTLEQKITGGITDFFTNHEDLTVRISYQHAVVMVCATVWSKGWWHVFPAKVWEMWQHVPIFHCHWGCVIILLILCSLDRASSW